MLEEAGNYTIYRHESYKISFGQNYFFSQQTLHKITIKNITISAPTFIASNQMGSSRQTYSSANAPIPTRLNIVKTNRNRNFRIVNFQTKNKFKTKNRNCWMQTTNPIKGNKFHNTVVGSQAEYMTTANQTFLRPSKWIPTLKLAYFWKSTKNCTKVRYFPYKRIFE